MALFRCGAGDATPKVNCIFVPSTSLGVSVCYEDGVRTDAAGPGSGVIFSDACGLEVNYSGSNVYVLTNITSDAITCYNRSSTTPTTAITISAGASQNVTSTMGLFIEF